MRNLVLIAILSVTPTIANAGDWYDDWQEVPVYESTTKPVYFGSAYCTYTDSNESWSTGVTYPEYAPSDFRQMCMAQFGRLVSFPTTNKTCLAEFRQKSCKITLPFAKTITETKLTGTKRVPIQPYPSSIDVERLGCTSNGARKFILHNSGVESASSMKVFIAGSPLYPDHQLYSGVATSNLLLTTYPSSDSMNIRVKLDSGSSYYATLYNASCSGSGNPIPLD